MKKTTSSGPKLSQRVLAEAIGTFCLVFMGCGSVMISQRFGAAMAPGTIPMVFGLAIGVMVFAVGHISGAQFNPAVTLGLAAVGRFAKKDVLAYLGAQFGGALLASALLYAILPAGPNYGATVPVVAVVPALVIEFVATFFLVFVITAVATDNRASGALAAIAIGSTIALDAFVTGPLTGGSMNPARSLAPALFEGQLGVLWIYFVAPIAGGVAATFTYEKLR